MKICKKCNTPKDDFYAGSNWCKVCKNADVMARRALDPDGWRKYQRQWVTSDTGRSKRRVYARGHRKDPQVRLAHNLRVRLRCALRDSQKAGSAVRDLGCSVPELKLHLESKFQPGMSWDNYGEWHIDHIRPLAKFDLTDRAQLLEACHYTNLQPLWAGDNLSKGSKHANFSSRD